MHLASSATSTCLVFRLLEFWSQPSTGCFNSTYNLGIRSAPTSNEANLSILFGNFNTQSGRNLSGNFIRSFRFAANNFGNFCCPTGNFNQQVSQLLDHQLHGITNSNSFTDSFYTLTSTRSLVSVFGFTPGFWVSTGFPLDSIVLKISTGFRALTGFFLDSTDLEVPTESRISPGFPLDFVHPGFQQDSDCYQNSLQILHLEVPTESRISPGFPFGFVHPGFQQDSNCYQDSLQILQVSDTLQDSYQLQNSCQISQISCSHWIPVQFLLLSQIPRESGFHQDSTHRLDHTSFYRFFRFPEILGSTEIPFIDKITSSFHSSFSYSGILGYIKILLIVSCCSRFHTSFPNIWPLYLGNIALNVLTPPRRATAKTPEIYLVPLASPIFGRSMWVILR